MMTILRGLGIYFPFGIERSDPPIPTGSIGALVFAESHTAPSNIGKTSGPDFLSPSGNTARALPSFKAFNDASSANLSATESRSRGMIPQPRRNQAASLLVISDPFPR